MEIINGIKQGTSNIVDPTIQFEVVTKTDNYTVKLTESGYTFVMNSSDNKTFTLPSSIGIP